MTMGQASTGSALADVIASARRLGVELDEDEATRWVAALEAESLGGDLVVDVDSGVYGHRVSMLDFSSRDIARFRAIGDVVGMPDRLSDVAIVTDEALRAVNEYFERRLAEVPSIRAHVDELVASANA
jgi:hypothetical protein